MRRLIALCGAISLIACTNNEAPNVEITLPTTESNVAGTFVLKSANGAVPPYNIPTNTSDVLTLLNDHLVIHADQTWADTVNYETDRTTGETIITFTSTSGTYNIADGHINFTKTQGGSEKFIGSVVGNDLSVNFNGRLFLYSR